jgi:hypothetical protein
VRRLVVTENMTADGVIDAAGDWFSPAGDEGSDSSDIESVLHEHMERQDALVLGRVTFEAFREYWPNQTEDTTGIPAHLNAVRKYVVSSSLDEPVWENTRVLRDLVGEVRALKAEPGVEIRRHREHQRRLAADRSRARGRIPPLRLPDDPRTRAQALRERRLQDGAAPLGLHAVPVRGRAVDLSRGELSEQARPP